MTKKNEKIRRIAISPLKITPFPFPFWESAEGGKGWETKWALNASF